nr:hypothetical protein [Candidatus Sigynarchaeum springense]
MAGSIPPGSYFSGTSTFTLLGSIPVSSLYMPSIECLKILQDLNLTVQFLNSRTWRPPTAASACCLCSFC